MSTLNQPLTSRFREPQHFSAEFHYWEKIKDLIDQNIDILLNYRQSGHPGGSRSKVHSFVVCALSGFMRWDIRRPEHPFADRFILGAGHTVPLIYSSLAVFNEALRIKFEQTQDPRYQLRPEYSLFWEDLLGFRRQGGLAGHAEQEGKTLFLKFNTGPSGHGVAASIGEAVALKRAKAQGVKVIVFEGEGGFTPGSAHEAKNSAWGLGLSNLYFVLDWNNYGIDDTPNNAVVPGTPKEWFEPYAWRVVGTEDGSSWNTVLQSYLELDQESHVPSMLYLKTRKGRGYLKYDNHSHGSPHPMNHEHFWTLRKAFMKSYGVTFQGVDQVAPTSSSAIFDQFRANLQVVAETLRADQALVDYLAERLLFLGEQVPSSFKDFSLAEDKNPLDDPHLWEIENYPQELYAPAGAKKPNRAALASFGSYLNSYCRQHYGRPLFLVCSADLAESTSIAGFHKPWKDWSNYGIYDREKNQDGVLFPQQITEFTNSGLTVGVATVNLSQSPFEKFNGFFAACSTYGSFSYLKYGMMRLFSQLNQDSAIQTGKVLWVVGHSGPETAEDSRTHFGIFAPGVTQLFPEGKVIELHPWEHNEVIPALVAAFRQKQAPIIALHLTRPTLTIPDRQALGMPSHFSAAKGAYLLRPYCSDLPRQGTIIVQGSVTTANVVQLLPTLEKERINVKLVAAISPQLFQQQDQAYQNEILSKADRLDSTYISNRAKRTMWDWDFNPSAREYAMTPDTDNRWRTGGTVEEVIEESQLSPTALMRGIQKFVQEREQRLQGLQLD
jgi:transketolase